MSEEAQVIDSGIADDVQTGTTDEGQQAPPADDPVGGIADDGKTAEQPEAGNGQPKVEPYELVAPEGYDVPEDNLKDFSKLCNEVGVTKEQAEKFLAWHQAQHEQNVAYAAQQETQVLQEWGKEIQSDPEFGGKNWKTTVADARRAFEAFDPDGALRGFLRETKYQHNPMIIRAVARVGRAMGEHGWVGAEGKGEGRRQVPLENRLWPDM